MAESAKVVPSGGVQMTPTPVEASVVDMVAPSQELMARVVGPDVEAISVQQTMRGCFQECLGCEAESEYRIYHGHIEEGQARAEGIPQVGHLLESSPCLCRFCLGVSRSFTMPLTLGEPTKEGGNTTYGPKVLEFRKPLSNPICFHVPVNEGGDTVPCPCCCFLPKLETFDNENTLLGSTKYICDTNLLVPKFGVFGPDGTQKYLVRPETCCGGCCVMIRCGGKGSAKSVYIPFLIRDPTTQAPLMSNLKLGGEDATARINKVWSGFKKECCSDADNFQVLFPQGATMHDKANLLGANVLIDFAYFETQKGN